MKNKKTLLFTYIFSAFFSVLFSHQKESLFNTGNFSVLNGIAYADAVSGSSGGDSGVIDNSGCGGDAGCCGCGSCGSGAGGSAGAGEGAGCEGGTGGSGAGCEGGGAGEGGGGEGCE